MKIEVRCRGMMTSQALREHVERRIHFGLSRFAGAVDTVLVRLSDTNGPRGGVDKRCQVAVRGPALPAITIEHLSDDAYAAVDQAVERAARAVRREHERVREQRPRVA